MAASQSNEWDREPLVPVCNEQETNQDRYQSRNPREWCHCRCCQEQQSPEMELCCRDHPIWQTHANCADENISCIYECQHIQQLLQLAPLRMMYHNFCAYHRPLYPDAELLQPSDFLSQEEINKRKNKQCRFSAYRSLIFWAYPHIRRQERRPLPSCLYAYIRALFPPTNDEEEFADYEFTIYSQEAADL